MRRYQDITVLRNSPIKEKVRFRATVKYPSVPVLANDIYVITTTGDRLDILANQFYGDPTLYWIIARGNPQLSQGSLTVPPGTQLRIPIDTTNIISEYKKLNKL